MRLSRQEYWSGVPLPSPAKLLSCVQCFATLWTVDCRFLCPWDSPGKNTGVGCHFLLQGIFPTQGSNLCLLCLLHWQVGPLPLSHQGSPCITSQYLKLFVSISLFFFFLPMDGEYLDVRDCVLANYAENVLFDNQMMTSEHLLFSLVVF